MLNLNYYEIKRTKKQYSTNLKNTEKDTYRLHEKLSTSLNQSLLSNLSETTASKTIINKNNLSNYVKKPVKEKKSYPIKKFSYINFLELRKPKNNFPLDNKEKRFKWQNLKDENIVLYPEIYKKPHKKQFLLKETFGEDILDFNGKEFDNKPKIRRLRRCLSEQGKDMANHIQNVDFDISRRVIEPLYNNEKAKISKKKSFSQSKYLLHKTNGGFKSLFELTPIDIPIKGKKLFKNKSYQTINIFEKNTENFEKPKNTKKIFSDNICYFDHIKDEDLISDMNKCWKFKRSKSTVERLKTKADDLFCLNKFINNWKLRNYDKNNLDKKESNKKESNKKENNKKENNKKLRKIKRNIKIQIKE